METQQLSAQRLLHEEKLVVKQQDLTIKALQEKITRLEKELGEKEKKCTEYDALTAQAIKSNIAINMCKEKAMVR